MKHLMFRVPRSMVVACLSLAVLVLAACGGGAADGPAGIDEDGNGVRAAPCAEAPWWDLEYLYRFALDLENPNAVEVKAGSRAQAFFDHDALVSSGRSLANGQDVRLVYFDGVDHVEVGRDASWNTEETVVFFTLQADLEPSAVGVTGYWIYFGNPEADAPSRAVGRPTRAYRADDPTKLLYCADVLSGNFYSLQLKQVSPGLFDAYVRDHTGDSGAYVKLIITDDLTGEELKNTTYDEDLGFYNNPGVSTHRFAIESGLFTVYMESREFSRSARIFGCETFSTGNPPTNQVGSNQFSYVQVFDPVAVPCGN